MSPGSLWNLYKLLPDFLRARAVYWELESSDGTRRLLLRQKLLSGFRQENQIMWDTFCVLISLACFSAGVLYVRACALLRGERDHA